MSTPFDETPELKAVAAALSGLSPTPCALNRDLLMFHAGQASMFRPRWPWPAASAVLGGVACVLAVLLWTKPRAEPERIYVQVPVPVDAPRQASIAPSPQLEPRVEREIASSETPEPASEGQYRKLEELVLRWGLDALASAPTTAKVQPPLTVNELLGQPLSRPKKTDFWNFENLFSIGGRS